MLDRLAACLQCIVLFFGMFGSVDLRAGDGDETPARPAHEIDLVWPRLGGAGNGYGEGHLPDRWTEQNYRWSVKTPAIDHGSPIIANDRVLYLATDHEASNQTEKLDVPNSDDPNPDDARGERTAIGLHCLDLATGRREWSHATPHRFYRTHPRNSQASSTPVADRHGIVYATADDRHTFLTAVDWSGDQLWQRDFGPWRSVHGFAASPAVAGDHVTLLLSMQAEELEPDMPAGDAKVVCVDRSTGRDVWTTEMTATRTCYNSPIFVDADPPCWLVPHRGDGVVAIDDHDGHRRWSWGQLNSRLCRTPVLYQETLIINPGGGGGGTLMAIDLPQPIASAPDREILPVRYEIKRGGPYVPGIAVADDRIHMVSDNGIASVVDWTDGKIIDRQRLGGNFAASPIVIGDRWLAISLDGNAHVLTRNDSIEVLGKIELGGTVAATPAVGNGVLVIRVGHRIVALNLDPH